MIEATIFLIGKQAIKWFSSNGQKEIETLIRKKEKQDENPEGNSRTIFFVFPSTNGNFEMVKSRFSAHKEIKKLLNQTARQYQIEEKELYDTMRVDTVLL